MERNEEFYDKVFSFGDTQLSRRDLEELPCPFCTDNVSDELMQDIVEIVNEDTRIMLSLEDDEHIDFENDEHNSMWWEVLERVCNAFEIPYYEDM